MDAGLIFQSEWLLTAVHSTKKDFYDRVHMATVIKVSLFKVWTDFVQNRYGAPYYGKKPQATPFYGKVKILS